MYLKYSYAQFKIFIPDKNIIPKYNLKILVELHYSHNK